MLSLYFIPAKFPRTIKRAEWYEIWRWKRVTQKRLIEELETQRLMLSVYGATMPDYVRRNIIDNMINPPLLVHDRMDLT